jgi:hypothetical protein
VTVTVSGTHDAFPDYEGFVNGTLIYIGPIEYDGPGAISLNTSVDFGRTNPVQFGNGPPIIYGTSG